ncbi:MAG: methyltransferase domain-containing protein [Phycisphaerales bacterium]
MAASLDAPAALLPYLGELFADVDSLGSSPRLVAKWLRSAGVGAGSRVLDVGCGKGAAAVEVARRTGCRVAGVDAFAPFVAAARGLAERRGVADRCVFSVGTARGARAAGDAFDAAIMLGVAPVRDAARILRRLVRPRGVYMIDDAAWIGVPGSPQRGGAPTLDEARALLVRAGDRILRERVLRPAEVRRIERPLRAALSARARALGRANPRLRPLLADYLARQRAAAALLEGPLRPVLWMVRRGGGR